MVHLRGIFSIAEHDTSAPKKKIIHEHKLFFFKLRKFDAQKMANSEKSFVLHFTRLGKNRSTSNHRARGITRRLSNKSSTIREWSSSAIRRGIPGNAQRRASLSIRDWPNFWSSSIHGKIGESKHSRMGELLWESLLEKRK